MIAAVDVSRAWPYNCRVCEARCWAAAALVSSRGRSLERGDLKRLFEVSVRHSLGRRATDWGR